MALCFLFGLLPFVMFRSLNGIIGEVRWSILLVLTVCLGLPLLPAANQIYPDLITGFLVFWAASVLLQSGHQIGKTAGVWQTCLIGAIIVILPWLHLKNVAPMLVLLAWSSFIQAKSHSLRHLLVLCLIAVISLALLATYNSHAFGSVWGPYSGGSALSHRPVDFHIKLTAIF